MHVLWKEGMFLEPHHFQLLERRQAAHVNTRINSLVYGGYQHGFSELEIDRDALLSGNFSIIRASGVFPDGCCFGVGATSAFDLPIAAVSSGALSRSFAEHCRADQQSLDVYLAVPVSRRYVERTVSIPDELQRDNNKDIEIGELNCVIRFEGEPLDDCVWLRAARLTRTGSGYMELARYYSPPVLFTRVSDTLRNCVSGLLELLWARIGSIERCRAQNGCGQAFFSPTQENSFRLLNTLCTFTPLLSRMHELPKIHPFDCYALLTALCGGLMSFASSVSLEKFPPFDHDDPASSFYALAGNVRDALKVEFWTNCTELSLEQVNAATWLCRFPHERFAADVSLYIGVSAKISQKELLLDVLQRMKAASRDKLDMLISSSLPGLSLIHVKNIPEGLAAKPEFVYFVVDRQGSLWEAVEASGTFGVHFTGGVYPEMKIEVLALKHQG